MEDNEKTKVIPLFRDEGEEKTSAPAKPRHAVDAKDKRLKDKNAKKLEKLLKKQKRRQQRLERTYDEPESDEERRDEEINAVEEPAMPEDVLYDVDDTVNDSRFSEEEDIDIEYDRLEEADSDGDDEAGGPVKKKKKYHKKRIIAALVIVLILFGIVFYAFNSDKLSVHNITNFIRYGVLNTKSEEHFPIDISGENVSAGNFIRSGQDICYSSDTKIQMLNNYGRNVFTAQHAFITPVLTVSKKGCLVYNLGGTGYEIVQTNAETYSADAEDRILVADYADNGSYAIVTQSSGYLSKLYVYNEKHEQIFAYSFADYYVTSVTLNSSGSKAVVSGLAALDGIEIASLYVLDFTKDTPLYFNETEDNIIYEVSYIGDKYACAVGRTASYVINTYNGELTVNDYGGSTLTAFDINTDTHTYTLSLSGSGDGRNCDIVSFQSSGKEERRFTEKEKIVGLSTYKGRVALLTTDSVLLYSKDGKRFSEKEFSSDPHSVVLYTSSDAYVLCTGYITSVTL